MAKPLSVGQIWLLDHMVSHDGLLYVGLSTWTCPEPVGMNTLRGLEKRGLCEATHTNGIFQITETGRAKHQDGKQRLADAIQAKYLKDLAQCETEES